MILRLAAVVVLLQLLILGFMAGEREMVIRHGRQVLLRTLPIDPNDPMRGAYVRLGYDFSTVPKALCRDGAAKMLAEDGYVYSRRWRSARVYAVLKQDAAGFASLDYLTDRRPDAGLFIRGRVESVNDRQLTVRYGIEAFFMQQDLAKKLELEMRDQRTGCPLSMRVAVGDNGIAVLQDYRWEPLGLTLDFIRETPPAEAPGNNSRPQNRREQRTIALDVTLKNHGDKEVAIVDLPESGSFHLVADNRFSNDNEYRAASSTAASITAEAGHILVLKPGEAHRTRINLRQPRWFVVETQVPAAQQKPIALPDIPNPPWSVRFRLEYRPPPAEQLSHLPTAALIYPGSLFSRAFNTQQSWD